MSNEDTTPVSPEESKSAKSAKPRRTVSAAKQAIFDEIEKELATREKLTEQVTASNRLIKSLKSILAAV